MGDYVVDRGDGSLSSAASSWWLYLIMGLAALVVGVLLLFDLAAAVGTLALLVSLGLLFAGVGMLAGSSYYRSAWTIIGGIAMVAAGVVALVWPDITLWALSVVVAMGLLVSGLAQLAAAFADNADGRGWLIAGGLISLVVGVMALAWPGATILALAILLGIHLVLSGIAEIGFAMDLRRLR